MTSELKFPTEQVTPNINRRGDLDLGKQQTLQTPFQKKENFLNNNEQIIQAQVSDQIQEKQFNTEVKPPARFRKPPLKKVKIALGVSSVSYQDMINPIVAQASNIPAELIGNLKLNEKQIKVAQELQQKVVIETNRTITPTARKQSRLEKKLAYEAMKRGDVLYTKEFQSLKKKMMFKEHNFEDYKELHKMFNVEGIFGLEQDLFYDEQHSDNSQIRKKEIEKIQEMQDAQVNEDDLDVMVEQDFQENNRKRPKGITYAQEMALHTGEGEEESLKKKNPLTNIGVYVVAQNVQQQYDQVKGQFSEDMCVKFGFHKMQQEFAKSLIKNQKIIFNELTAEEKEALKKKKIEDLQKLELQELIRNKALREAREEQAILDAQPNMIIDPHQESPMPKLITKPPIDTERFLESFGQINHTGLSLDAINAQALQGLDGGFTTRRTARMSDVGGNKLFPLKELNVFEIDAVNEDNLIADELMNENLKIAALAKHEILHELDLKLESRDKHQKPFVESQVEKALIKEYEAIFFAKEEEVKIAKKNARYRLLISEIPNIKNIEKNFAEQKERKKAEKLAKAQVANKYPKTGKITRKTLSGQLLDKFGNVINNDDQLNSDSDELPDDQDDSGNSSFDSEASRVNFWKDINVGDEHYKNAIIVSKKNMQRFQEKSQNKGMGASTYDGSVIDYGSSFDGESSIHKRSAGAPKKREVQVIAIKTYEVQIKALKKKMQKIKLDHERDKKRIKKAALSYAINYYKSKSKDLTQIFTKEGLRMLSKYTFLRRTLLKRDDQLQAAGQRTICQELVIAELRQFIEKTLSPALMILDQMQEGTGALSYIPGQDKNTEDPIYKFQLFQSIVAEKTDDTVLQKLKDTNQRMFKEQIILTDQVEAFQSALEVLGRDMAILEKKNLDLECDKAKLEADLIILRTEKDKVIAQLQEEFKEMKKHLETEIEKLSVMANLETNVNLKVQFRLQEQVQDLQTKLRQLKNVIKVPRLNRKYQDIMQNIESKEQLEATLKSKLVQQANNIDNLEKEDLEDLKSALQTQFSHEYDIANFRDRILQNISLFTKKDNDDIDREKLMSQIIFELTTMKESNLEQFINKYKAIVSLNSYDQDKNQFIKEFLNKKNDIQDILFQNENLKTLSKTNLIKFLNLINNHIQKLKDIQGKDKKSIDDLQTNQSRVVFSINGGRISPIDQNYKDKTDLSIYVQKEETKEGLNQILLQDQTNDLVKPIISRISNIQSIKQVDTEGETETSREKIYSQKIQRSKDQKASDLFKVVPQKILTPTNQMSQSSNLSLQEDQKNQIEFFQKRQKIAQPNTVKVSTSDALNSIDLNMLSQIGASQKFGNLLQLANPYKTQILSSSLDNGQFKNKNQGIQRLNNSVLKGAFGDGKNIQDKVSSIQRQMLERAINVNNSFQVAQNSSLQEIQESQRVVIGQVNQIIFNAVSGNEEQLEKDNWYRRKDYQRNEIRARMKTQNTKRVNFNNTSLNTQQKETKLVNLPQNKNQQDNFLPASNNLPFRQAMNRSSLGKVQISSNLDKSKDLQNLFTPVMAQRFITQEETLSQFGTESILSNTAPQLASQYKSYIQSKISSNDQTSGARETTNQVMDLLSSNTGPSQEQSQRKNRRKNEVNFSMNFQKKEKEKIFTNRQSYNDSNVSGLFDSIISKTRPKVLSQGQEKRESKYSQLTENQKELGSILNKLNSIDVSKSKLNVGRSKWAIVGKDNFTPVTLN